MATKKIPATTEQINALLQSLAEHTRLDPGEWVGSNTGSGDGGYRPQKSDDGFSFGDLVKKPWHGLVDTLNFIERPLYAIGGALTEGTQANIKGADVGDTLKAIGGGALHGLEGKTHHDFTDLLQSSADAYAAAQMGKSNADVEFKDKETGAKGDLAAAGLHLPKWAKAAGLGSDIAADPLNLIALGGLKTIRGAEAVPKARQTMAGVDQDLHDVMSAAGHSDEDIIDLQDTINKEHKAQGLTGTTPYKSQSYYDIRAKHLGGLDLEDPLVAAKKSAEENIIAEPAVMDDTGAMDRLVRNTEEAADTHLTTGAKLGNEADNAAASLPRLPKHLAGSKPRFGAGGGVNFGIQFDDDVTKALYIVASTRKTSAAEPQFMKFLKDHFGNISDAEVRSLGQTVKNSVREAASTAEDGVIRVKTNPALFAKTPEHAAASEAKAAVAEVLKPHTKESVTKAMLDKMAKERAATAAAPYVSKLLEGEAGSRQLTAAAKLALKDKHLKDQGITPSILDSIKNAASRPSAAQVDEKALWAEADKIAKERRLGSFKEVVAKAKNSSGFKAARDEIAREAQKRLGHSATDTSGAKALADLNKGLKELQAKTLQAEIKKEVASAAKAAKPAKVVAGREIPLATDVAAAENIADKAIAAINSGKYDKFKTFNSSKQKNMWNEIRRHVVSGVVNKAGDVKNIRRLNISASQFEKSLQMLTHSIDSVIEKTSLAPVLQPKIQVPFRLDTILRAGMEAGVPIETLAKDEYLSTIIKAYGNDANALSKLSDAEKAMLNKIKSEGLIKGLDKVAPIIDGIEQTVKEAKIVGNPVEMAETKAAAPLEAEAAAKAQGVEGAVAEGVTQAAKDIAADIPANPSLKVMQGNTERLAETPIKTPDFKTIHILREETQAIQKQLRLLGIRGTDYYLIKTVKGAEALARLAEGTPNVLKVAFNNAHGMANIWPELRAGQASAETMATLRVQQLEQLLQHPALNSPEKLNDAFKSLATKDFENEGSKLLSDWLEPYLHGRTSLLNRMGIGLEEVNPFLKAEGLKVEFTSGMKGPLGESIPATRDNLVEQLSKVDLSTLNAANPVGELLYGVTNAVEKMHAEAQVMSSLAATLGTTKNVKGFITVNHPRLQGIQFPPEIGKELNTYITKVEELATSARKRDEFSNLMQGAVAFHDGLLRGWKKGVTRYTPGYYTRNFMGDAWISWVKGVNNPMRYKQGFQVLHQMGKIAESPEFWSGAPLEELVGAIDDVILKGTKHGNITASQIATGYHRAGVAQSMGITENFRKGINTSRSITRPFAGKVGNSLDRFAELAENAGRLPHFIDEVAKQIPKTKSLEEAMHNAGMAVRKAHFDYGDLTAVEKKVMKRLIPFYTWSRKSIPFLLENFMLQPWKMMVVPKMNYAIAEMMGQDPMSFAEPWPIGSDMLLPKWVKTAQLAQWAGGDTPLMGKIPDPFTDTSVGGPGVSMVSPFIKWPIDMLSIAKGNGPLTSTNAADMSRYIDSQIPVVSKIGSATNTSPVAGGLESLVSNPKPGTGFGRTTDPTDPGGGAGLNIANLLAALSGIGLSDVNKQRQKSAQYERQGR